MNFPHNKSVFSIKEALAYPFVTFYNRPLAVLGITLSAFIYFIPTFILAGIFFLLNRDTLLYSNFTFTNLLYNKINLILVIAILLIGIIGVLWYRVFLISSAVKLYNKKEIEFSDLFEKSDSILKLLGYYILFGLLFALGLVLLVIPGIYWYITYVFGEFFIVDKGADVFEAFTKSAKITSGLKLKLFGYFILLTILVSLLSLVPIVAILIEPIRIISKVYVYKKIS
ncbi:hypothetical protein M1446_00830 [Candidatus Dependentiae bacterium]|nr:hypothetical protein [Candidatus Dependentiae bacterium]